jgi:hypothetical protein
MDEGVLAAGFVGDEAVAAVVVEEFHGADSHDRVLSMQKCPRAKGAAGPV